MCTASGREHEFRKTYLERCNGLTRKCTRRQGESSISEKCHFPMNSKCAQRRGEMSIFEKPILRREIKLNENVHRVEARASFLISVISFSDELEMCTASGREHDFRRTNLERLNVVTRKCTRCRGGARFVESVISRNMCMTSRREYDF